MKAKITFLSLCFIASFLSMSLFSQEKITETPYFKNNPALGQSVDWISYEGEKMISQILKDGKKLWIAGNSGLMQLDTETEVLTTHELGFSDLPLLRNLAKDNDGNLWITTQRDGVVQYDGRKLLAHYMESNSALSNNQYCTSIAIDASNNKWIGSLLYLNKFNGTAWQAWTTPQSALANYWFIYDLKFDRNGDLWMGGDSPEWRFAKFTGEAIQPVSGITKAVSRILVDKDNNKWLASLEGLIKYDGTHVVTWNTGNSSLPANDIYDIKQDASGNLWLACSKYLIRFDGHEFTRYTNPLLQEGDERDFISCLEPDDSGNIWLGTKLSGLFKFTQTQESFQPILKSATGIVQSVRSTSNLFPNPVNCSSVLNIHSEKILETIEVYDISGRQIQRKHIGTSSVQIPISELNIFQQGIYILRLVETTGISIKKLIVK
jgi:ligand-binding sensor domain-containing protein